MQFVTRAQALLATIAYADVFDYPLTRQELVTWLLFYPQKKVVLPKHIMVQKNVLYLSWRKRIVHFRMEKMFSQEGKWRIAKHASVWLTYVPTIRLIGVTGGLAMNNAKADDDVDLFFIVAPGTLWISRLLATLIMDLLGLRRHPQEQAVADKVCLNMFMTENALSLPEAERDCFSAHEVLQMTPLWQRRGVYKNFLQKNSWVKYFLPNAFEEKYRTQNTELNVQHGRRFLYPFLVIGFWVLRFMEKPARFFQLWYMHNHRTSEVITSSMLRFHPKDARVWVKKKWEKRLKKIGVPIDNIFYPR